MLPATAGEATPVGSGIGARTDDGQAVVQADGSVMQSFSIHTSAATAQKMVNEEVSKQTSLAAPVGAPTGGGEIARSDPVVRNGRVRMHNAVSYGGVVYLSGQVGSPEHGDVAVQTVEILEKIDSLLAANAASKATILQATIWLADMRHFTQMNAVWDAWVDQENAPVRACVEARLATPGHLVEIQVTAAQQATAAPVPAAPPAAAPVTEAAPSEPMSAEAIKAKKKADRMARMAARDAEAGISRD